jgi:SLOG in TRPM, prokaryote
MASDAAGDLPGPRHAWVDKVAELPEALRALGVGIGRPVVVCVGGAAGMAPEDLTAMARLLTGRIVSALDGWGAAVVDGGTDTGVMQVMGRVRQATGASFPLIGVAALGTVVVPGGRSEPDAAELEPHHTHVVLVPGDAWGDESPWLSCVATLIAGGRPSLTLVVNGGEITYDDISRSLEDLRPVIVLAGTGRVADSIAAAAAGGDAVDPRAAQVAASPLTRIVPFGDWQALYSAIESILAPADG